MTNRGQSLEKEANITLVCLVVLSKNGVHGELDRAVHQIENSCAEKSLLPGPTFRSTVGTIH